ncbi:MAG: hypothetical protein A2031_03580 [Deltaproteobacteria bacterium RBG_19FT_COMBO_43_11]|nr:MAG: hypothetical protein A2W27_09020 [Deltaproteobacteria bacterium RBG_16_44_11]OGP90757.1 MAG: hypothetical protein A2031_03580 [Deltaproteobacteria bacterium RBG_19FT_COMBO_43_11]
MQAFLDMRTLIFTSGVTSMFLFVCMVYARQKQKTYDGFLYWIFASLTNATGMILLSQRDIWPDFLTVVIANACLILSMMLVNIGLNYFTGLQPRNKLYLLSLLVFLMVFVYFTYALPNLTFRIVVFSGFQSTLYVIAAILIYRDLPRILPQKNYILFRFFIFCAIWPVLRIISSFVISENPVDLIKAGFFHQLTVLVSIAAFMIMYIGLIVINAQRVEQEMIDAKNDIKTIAGLIPICANCKKIRDGKGSWNKLETYLSKHNDIEFSHGICPECMQKSYPVK